MAKDEPQSYGSQAEWNSGDVGQTVNRQKSEPTPQNAEFYESRHDHDEIPGTTSPLQIAESVEPIGATTGDDKPVQKVTGQPTGAKRGGYFKKRDYE